MSALPDRSLVVVTPIYEDSEASSRLFLELAAVFGPRVFVVAVDDGSVLKPVEVANIEKAGLAGVVIRLKRNVGHQRAIAIGLNYVAAQLPQAQRIVVMDSDGEDTPASIRELTLPLESSLVDVVVAQRKSRVETLRFRMFYVVYRWLFEAFTGRRISFGNFMALTPAALKRLVAMQELWIHIAGCVLASKLRVALCPLDRGQRYAGQSKMNFVGLALHGFRALMVFAEDVLVRVGIACSLVAALSILGGAAAVILKLLGIATPGWFSVAIGILFLVFLQTGTLTLVTLMLTGIVRGGSVVAVDYQEFIDVVLPAAEPAATA
jgi:glycosyltransferase involved in cell wall biosynthesis